MPAQQKYVQAMYNFLMELVPVGKMVQKGSPFHEASQLKFFYFVIDKQQHAGKEEG